MNITDAQHQVLDLFNCMVVEEDQLINSFGIGPVTSVFLNFVPTAPQKTILLKAFSPLNISTLFSVEERKNGDINELLLKQVLHYVEVYGLNSPGLFDLEVSGGKIATLNYVEGVTVNELQRKIQTLLYANAPVKDATAIVDLIKVFRLDIDVSQIKNNEVRVLICAKVQDNQFVDGDDAVRYLCYLATGDMLLIKDKRTIDAVSMLAGNTAVEEVLKKNKFALSQVFNRHKRLILAAKNHLTVSLVNEISRMSKKNHVPIQEPISKRFVSEALQGNAVASALKHVSVRDKLKYLNLLAFKKAGYGFDIYAIRNGKVFVDDERPQYDADAIQKVTDMVIKSLKDDVKALRGKHILLDSSVDYGLPTSRKQTLGNLPRGTVINTDADEISSGIYWENAWGATDLDLSTVDSSGHRVGWGQLSGYNDRKIIFSGDQTYAANGAMEFMTSANSVYGVFVNIFSGDSGAGVELVVGSNGKGQWIKDTIIREKTTLESRGNILGFVNGKKFIVYNGRVLNVHTSGNTDYLQVFASKALADSWTISTLLDALNIDYDLDADKNVAYDHNLSYPVFSYDKLEALFS